MQSNNILIAAIQETKLTAKSKLPNIKNFALIRSDRSTNKGGGVAFLVHDSVPFKIHASPDNITKDPHVEEISITINGEKSPNLTIRNVYIPPASSCSTPGWSPNLPSLSHNLPEPFLILGDFNCHHQSIYSADQDDQRGIAVLQWINDLNLGIINEDVPTRTTNTCSSAPDITVASPAIIPTTSWEVKTSLSSDRLPIHITISTEVKLVDSQKRTFINFKKADWPNFKDFIEAKILAAPELEDINKREKLLRDTITTAAKVYIPAGRIPKVINEFPQEAVTLIKDRDTLRAADPTDPRIPDLNAEIHKIVADHKRDKWMKHLDSCEPNTKKLWDTVKSLSSAPNPPQNQSISFDGKTYDNPQKIADKLNQQYTPGVTAMQGQKPSQEFRSLLRSIQTKPDEPPSFHINAGQVSESIKSAKNSKAIGPDGISPIMLKNLGPIAINFITKLFNDILLTAIIPPLWKTGRIIPLPKPGKPSNEGKSYRPVSLLSPLAKLLESVLLPHLQSAVHLEDHQHGFRKGRSCTTALQDITGHIKKGLNRHKPVHRTVMVAVDLTCAFDTVSHKILIKDINDLPLDPYIKRFLCGYLRGRKTFVEFRNHKSKCRQMRQGVPQGGVLSPTLFNMYISSMPAPPPGIKVTSYADDTTVMKSGPKIPPLCKALNEYLETLHKFFTSRNLGITPGKSTATIFTTCTQDMAITLPIKIDGKTVPTVKNPKILGTHLDPLLTFGHHAKVTADKISKRNNILRALAGSSWGKDKETITTTYKAIGRSCLNYCAPIWTPTLSETNWISLQAVQNAALRTATGCVKKSSISHLHSETKLLQVKEHNMLLSKQFHLATKKQGHPNFSIPHQVPERTMKADLGTLFEEEIGPLFSQQGNSKAQHNIGMRELHTSAVRSSIENASDNKVLGHAAPEINVSEKSLPRETRVSLAQLRSGYSSKLFSYLHDLWPNRYDSDLCPKCRASRHDTAHLFACPMDPTHLTPLDLWKNPVEVATFLGLRTRDGDQEDDPGGDGRQGDPG